jgi:hypothetical protein
MPTEPSAARAAPSLDLGSAVIIQAAYGAITTAFDDGRIDLIPTYLTGDYTETEPHGKVLDKQAAMKNLRDQRNQITSVQCAWSIETVTNAPSGAIVQVKLHSQGTGCKRIAFFKVNGTFTNDMLVRDYWIDTPVGWRMKSRIKIVDESHVQAG